MIAIRLVTAEGGVTILPLVANAMIDANDLETGTGTAIATVTADAPDRQITVAAAVAAAAT